MWLITHSPTILSLCGRVALATCSGNSDAITRPLRKVNATSVPPLDIPPKNSTNQHLFEPPEYLPIFSAEIMGSTWDDTSQEELTVLITGFAVSPLSKYPLHLRIAPLPSPRRLPMFHTPSPSALLTGVIHQLAVATPCAPLV
jgi:hypothetical protein